MHLDKRRIFENRSRSTVHKGEGRGGETIERATMRGSKREREWGVIYVCKRSKANMAGKDVEITKFAQRLFIYRFFFCNSKVIREMR